MWLIKSSIGRKFIMALTGICLVLFVTFHVLMNAVAIIWPGAYNQVCQFLGANWYALIASAGLGLLVIIHIIDALVLTIQNRKARGNDRYAVSNRPKTVEWSSQNMLVLGIVVLVFLGVHLVQFWARMQAQEIIGSEYEYNGVELPAAAGTLFLQIAFQNWWTPVIYIIGFIALWFHLNHGFWSMWQSVGCDNDVWLPRWKAISRWWVTIVVGLFIVETAVFTVRANQNFYFEDATLQSQYKEMIFKHTEKVLQPLSDELQALDAEVNNPAGAYVPGMDSEEFMKAQSEKRERFETLYRQAMEIANAAEAQVAAIKNLANSKESAKPAESAPAPQTEK